MPQVTITHSDGSTETIPKTVRWTDERELGKMRKLTITVERSDAQAVTLSKKSDEIELVGEYTGRLVDINKGGSTWTLIVYSFEWDANRHAPTAGGVSRTQDDAAHMDQFINSVSEWTIGTTTAQTGTVTFVFNHAFAHEGMRRVERNCPGELRWNADKSVDYVDALGSDKSASITLSAAQQNIDGEIKVEDRGRTMDATHVRVIGAHEGEAQLETNLVPAADSGNFTEEVTYTQPRWSSAADTDWARWSNKDLMSQDAVDEAASALGDELTDEHIEATATVVGEDLALGDTVHVDKPEADIDRDMRIHRIKTVSEGPTVRHKIRLSTRNLARDTEEERIRDTERFNVAFQGSAVWGTPSGGYQAVTSSDNYRLTFFYPDVAFEHTAELYVESQPYRTFHSGAAAVSENITSTVFTDSGDDVLLTAGNSDTISNNVGSNFITDEMIILADLDIHDSSFTEQGPVPVAVELFSPTQTLYTAQISLDELGFWSETVTTTEIDENDSIDLVVGNNDSSSFQYDYGITGYAPDHRHPANPGVSEFASETASGVDVIVNGGSPVSSNIGSGAFETTVDITGELTKGAFNTVELTSDSTGWLYATAGLEAYRQIGTN